MIESHFVFGVPARVCWLASLCASTFLCRPFFFLIENKEPSVHDTEEPNEKHGVSDSRPGPVHLGPESLNLLLFCHRRRRRPRGSESRRQIIVGVALEDLAASPGCRCDLYTSDRFTREGDTHTFNLPLTVQIRHDDLF